jgi:hypothetical protein
MHAGKCEMKLEFRMKNTRGTAHLRDLRKNGKQRYGMDATDRGCGPAVRLCECSTKYPDSIK